MTLGAVGRAAGVQLGTDLVIYGFDLLEEFGIVYSNRPEAPDEFEEISLVRIEYLFSGEADGHPMLPPPGMGRSASARIH